MIRFVLSDRLMDGLRRAARKLEGTGVGLDYRLEIGDGRRSVAGGCEMGGGRWAGELVN